MPWVRLHGVKDYIGMANILAEFPEIKTTFNYTPSLLLQLKDYIGGISEDREFTLSKKTVEDLTKEEKVFILNTFFQAHEPRFIYPFRRYKELHKKRQIRSKNAEEVLSIFSNIDIRDLIVWFNLVWVHQSEYKKHPELLQLLKKERDFTEEDQFSIVNIHEEILNNIIPLHKTLLKREQIEITTTPFYHPILPLLVNPASARMAMPNVNLPREMYRMSGDAGEQIRRGIQYTGEVFGCGISGMWPSEGSVSEEVLSLFIDNGIKWIATDEAVLERSLKLENPGSGTFSRTDIYSPYNFETGERSISLIFRDHNLSDLIGFKFQYYDPVKAAKELISNIEDIGKTVPDNSIVPVILDGENAWEFYSENAIPFFRELYKRLSGHKKIKTTRISEYLEEFPPKRTLKRLHSGSWINADFYIWMGHAEDQRAWDYLYKTRDDLIKAEDSGDIPENDIKDAWEEMFIAQGSDWCWWYGDDHFSGQDDVFDYLFRRHLMNIYDLIKKPVPDFLTIPIAASHDPLKLEQITSFLDVTVDGRVTSFFEWLKAGRFSPLKDSSSMTSVIDRKIQEVLFGFNLKTLFLRIDFEPPFLDGGKDELEIEFLTSPVIKLIVKPGMNKNKILRTEGKNEVFVETEWALDTVFEMAVPFETLGFKERELIKFFISLKKDGAVWERIPLTSPLSFMVPDKDYESYYWSV